MPTLPAATIGNTIVTLTCGASNVADSLLVTTANAFVVAGTSSTDIIGVTHGAAVANQPADVALPHGVVSLTASEAISAGAKLSLAANGKVQAWTAGENVIAEAITASSADGDKIQALFTAGQVATSAG